MNNKKDNSKDADDILKKVQNLNILKMSYFSIILAVTALIITLLYMRWKMIKSLDEINNTNFSQQIGDLTEFPKRANIIAMISTIIFIIINNYVYQNAQSVTGKERDEATIGDAWRNLAATILFLLGTYLNYTVINRPK